MEEAIQISKNFIKGEPVKDAQELLKLAIDKKSVYRFSALCRWGFPAQMLNKAPMFNSSKMLNLVPMPHLHKTDVTCRFFSVVLKMYN